MTSKLKLLVATSIIPAALMSASSAYAAGTLVGTDVSNNVQVDYQVGGVIQTQKTASDTFKVDRKILFTVAETTPAATTSVVAGQPNAVTTFVVNNTSNDTLDFDLAGTQLATGAAAKRGTDAFDVTGLLYFVDANNNGTYESATDVATRINDLAPDTSVRVFIIGNIGLTQTNGQVAGVTLTGTAKNSDNTAIVAATDATANTAAVETIFADTGRNGIEADSDDYTLSTAALTVSKLSRIVSDGVSTTGNPKAIPGAIVEYCIVVSNAASAATATNVAVSDNLTAINGVTYVPSSAFIDGTVVAGNTCTAGGTAGTYTSGTDTVSGTLTNIAAGQTRTLVFRVTID